ncbi:MAG: lyase family protein [Thermoguttaceae bacterium]
MLKSGLTGSLGLAGASVRAQRTLEPQEAPRPTTMKFRKETDSLGEVDVPADSLWGAQTQRSLEHFGIGPDLIPREMIAAYTILKKAAAIANHAGKRLGDAQFKLIVQVCDEILEWSNPTSQPRNSTSGWNMNYDTRPTRQ